MEDFNSIISIVSKYFGDPMQFAIDDGSRVVDGKIIHELQPFSEVSDFELLGSGAFSNVYGIDDKRALKISMRPDKSYDEFAQLCMDNPRNIFLPKIYYRGFVEGKQVYIMEKLEDIYSAWERKGRFRDAIQRDNIIEKYNLVHPDMAALQDWAEQYDWNDMHDGNIMFRDGDTPVLVDPCSNCSGTGYTS